MPVVGCVCEASHLISKSLFLDRSDVSWTAKLNHHSITRLVVVVRDHLKALMLKDNYDCAICLMLYAIFKQIYFVMHFPF